MQMRWPHVPMARALFTSLSNKANVKPCVDSLLILFSLLGIREYDEKNDKSMRILPEVMFLFCSKLII